MKRLTEERHTQERTRHESRVALQAAPMWSDKPNERLRLELKPADGSVKAFERLCSTEKTLRVMDALVKGVTRK